MDQNATRNVIEAALLAAGRPLPFDKIVEIFERKGVDFERSELRAALSSLSDEYSSRGIELKEVASGFRVQIRSSARDWLDPLFEERAPRYTRALLETLALIAYRQPITRAEIEEVRGVVVSTNIVRTLVERGWVRVVGYRDVPGKPSMLGTTKEFLDYFGLKRLEDLPPLAELRDMEPGASQQEDLLDRLEEAAGVPVEIMSAQVSAGEGDAAAPGPASPDPAPRNAAAPDVSAADGPDPVTAELDATADSAGEPESAARQALAAAEDLPPEAAEPAGRDGSSEGAV